MSLEDDLLKVEVLDSGDGSLVVRRAELEARGQRGSQRVFAVEASRPESPSCLAGGPGAGGRRGAHAEPGESYLWLRESSRGGTSARSELLEVAEATTPAGVAEALHLPPGGPALLRAQLLLIDDEPAELVQSYCPLEIARGTATAKRRRIKGGTPALLADLGYPPRLSIDRVPARVPTQEQCRPLQLPGDLPVLCMLRVVHSDGDRAIEASVVVKAGHLYESRYEFITE